MPAAWFIAYWQSRRRDLSGPELDHVARSAYFDRWLR